MPYGSIATLFDKPPIFEGGDLLLRGAQYPTDLWLECDVDGSFDAGPTQFAWFCNMRVTRQEPLLSTCPATMSASAIYQVAARSGWPGRLKAEHHWRVRDVTGDQRR